MANTVDGLRNLNEGPHVGGRASARVQAPDPNSLRAPGLRPTASPVDTYIQPQAPQQGNEWLSVAKALGAINPAITGFLQEEGMRRKQEQEDLAQQRLGGMTYKEHLAFMKAKGPEMKDPWFKAAAMKMWGERRAYKDMQNLTEAYQTFDKEGGDFDAFVSDTIKKSMGEYGNNKFFSSSYMHLMSGFRAKAEQNHVENQSKLADQDNINGTYETFYGQAREMLADGKSPDEVVTALRGRYEANKNLLGQSFREQDAQMVRVAASFAEKGNLEMVKAILEGDRTGADGTKLGSLVDSGQFGTEATKILNAAEAKRDGNNRDQSLNDRIDANNSARSGTLDVNQLKKINEARPGTFTDSEIVSLSNANAAARARAQAELERGRKKRAAENAVTTAENGVLQENVSLAMHGKAAQILDTTMPTASGGTRTWTADDQRKQLADYLIQMTNKDGEKRHLSPEQVLDEQIALLSSNGLPNEQWTNTLTTGFYNAAGWNISGDNIPPAIEEGVKLYDAMYAKSPQYLNLHIKDKNVRRFYEAYRLAKKYLRANDKQAIANAAQVTKDGGLDHPLINPTRDEVQSAVDEIGSGSSWFNIGPIGVGGSGAANNPGYVAEQITKTISEIGQLGTLLPKDAEKEAVAIFKRDHTNINGQWVYTADRSIPADFKELATGIIADRAEKLGLDPAGLTLRPLSNGTGAWELVNTGVAQLRVGEAKDSVFTLSDMYQFKIDQTKAKITKLKEDQAARAARREADATAAKRAADLNKAQHFLNDGFKQKWFENQYGKEALRKELERSRQLVDQSSQIPN